MKQYINYFFLIFLATTGLNAQNWTDALPHDRNVVLEEFTGIRCGFCPDGHRIAHEIDSANTGRVVVIGIHTGSYAVPSSGSQPDFQTQWGSSISGMSSLTGYPSGMVNRSVFPDYSSNGSGGKAMGRFQWEDASNIILNSGDTAGVNIGVRSLWDESTRTLSIDVELYYVKDYQHYNKLTVALLQNNIEGYQGGSSHNPSQIMPNGDYNHMHVLRDLITGVEANSWSGIKIDSVNAGNLVTHHFDYVVASDLNSIPIDIENCELAVFVTEWLNSPIITGVKLNAKNDSTTAPAPQNTHNYLAISKPLQVYPNPSNGEVIFDLVSNTKGKIIIWDLLGNIVLQKSITNRKTKVNTKGLNSGLYLYKLKTDKTSYSGKIMVR
jgi:hypothetical protein